MLLTEVELSDEAELGLLELTLDRLLSDDMLLGDDELIELMLDKELMEDRLLTDDHELRLLMELGDDQLLADDGLDDKLDGLLGLLKDEGLLELSLLTLLEDSLELELAASPS